MQFNKFTLMLVGTTHTGAVMSVPVSLPDVERRGSVFTNDSHDTMSVYHLVCNDEQLTTRMGFCNDHGEVHIDGDMVTGHYLGDLQKFAEGYLLRRAVLQAKTNLIAHGGDEDSFRDI